MDLKRVGVLMGGTSAERDVSLQSGRAVLRALHEAGHCAVPIELDDASDLGALLRTNRIDVAFLALHGRFGEDGCVQGALELLGIPYTGSSVLASALGMDKLKAKELFRLHNVPTPAYYVYSGVAETTAILECHGAFGYPAIVKPRRDGSSLGVSRADDPEQLVKGVRRALANDDQVLVERFVRGREVTVGILDGRVLGALEVAPKQGFYDYQAKYQKGQTEYHLPARLTATLYQNVLNLAERSAQALGTTGAVRVDFIVSDEQNEFVLELNTLPGMTPTSLLPKIAQAAGFDFPHLCEAILEGARLHVARCQHAGGESKRTGSREAESPLRVAVG